MDDPAVPVPADEDLAHLTRSLRLRDGEVVVAADGRGRWCACRFRPGAADRALDPDGPVVEVPPPAHPVTVAFALVKAERPDWVVQKLTEIGVDRIVPLLTERSVVVWSGERAEKGVERFFRVARQAAMQSRRAWLPEVSGMQDVKSLAAGLDVGPAGPGSPGRLALAHPGGEPPRPDRLAVAIGPEGGWSPAELALGLPTMGLGPTILRAETAAVAAGVLLCNLR